MEELSQEEKKRLREKMRKFDEAFKPMDELFEEEENEMFKNIVLNITISFSIWGEEMADIHFSYGRHLNCWRIMLLKLQPIHSVKVRCRTCGQDVSAEVYSEGNNSIIVKVGPHLCKGRA